MAFYYRLKTFQAQTLRGSALLTRETHDTPAYVAQSFPLLF